MCDLALGEMGEIDVDYGVASGFVVGEGAVAETKDGWVGGGEVRLADA